MTASLKLKSETLRELYDHYLSLSDEVPHEKQIDPSSFPSKLFPYICLFEVVPESNRYFAKLVGNALIHYAKHDYRNQFLDELPTYNRLGRVVDWYQSCLKERRPAAGFINFVCDGDVELPAERLFLPFVNDDNEIRKFIVAISIQNDGINHALP
ncbi:MAG: hypothetical protein R3261_00660 [Alphaproteobacteria bacterium]|nr:hypothetical protein [Alphaproteobacteria bacterium]